MSDLTLNKSVNLNVIFIISTVVGFVFNTPAGRSAILVTLVFLFLFMPTVYIVNSVVRDRQT